VAASRALGADAVDPGFERGHRAVLGGGFRGGARGHFKARFDWPFDRFYLNEKLAPEADKWLAESLRGAKGVTAEVRVLDGRAVLFDLSLGGRSFREHLKERLEGGKTPAQD